MNMNLYQSKTYLTDLDTALSATVGIQRLKGKALLITGATGTIGSFIVDMLLRYNQTENAQITVYASGRSIQRLEARFAKAKTDRLV